MKLITLINDQQPIQLYLNKPNLTLPFCLQVWKRSGAWFFKGFPKHELPPPMPVSKTKTQNPASDSTTSETTASEQKRYPRAQGRGEESTVICFTNA